MDPAPASRSCQFAWILKLPLDNPDRSCRRGSMRTATRSLEPDPLRTRTARPQVRSFAPLAPSGSWGLSHRRCTRYPRGARALTGSVAVPVACSLPYPSSLPRVGDMVPSHEFGLLHSTIRVQPRSRLWSNRLGLHNMGSLALGPSLLPLHPRIKRGLIPPTSRDSSVTP